MDFSSASVKFARAYAEAVLAYIDTQQPQEVYWDADELTFRRGALAEGIAPDDVGVYVGSGWRQAAGPVQVNEDSLANPIHRDALRGVLVETLTHSDLAQTYMRILLHEAGG